MAFVNEELKEKDKEFIASFKFLQPIGGGGIDLAKIPRKWAADREANHYLICLGGQGWKLSEEYPPNYYRLIIGNSAIEIEARFQSKGDYTNGVNFYWYIQIIVVPKALSNLSEKVLLQIVKDAFTSYSNIHGNDHVIDVEFKELVSPFYSKID